MPRHVRTQNYESYDGLADPVAFLMKFSQAMRVMGGDTYEWLTSHLLAYRATALHGLRTYQSIDSWNTFVNLFIESVSTSRDENELKQVFKYIRMVEGEKLRDFLHRFHLELQKVPRLPV